MEDMANAHAWGQQRSARWLLLSLPLVTFATTFIELYIAFLVTRALVPDMLGQVADRPAAFAALIALVASPIHVAVTLVLAWRVVRTALTGAELPKPAVRTRWRRIGGYQLGVLSNLAAALIVFKGISDPGATRLAPLLAVTVLGPVLLFWSLKGLNALRRWGWRRWTNRGYQPRHPASADQTTAVRPSKVD